MIKLKTVLMKRTDLMIISNENTNSFDVTIDMVNKKLLEIQSIYDGLKNTSVEISNNLLNSANSSDFDIFYNNLKVINSVMKVYEDQIIFLSKKMVEYYLILNSNVIIKKNFLKIWSDSIKIFFETGNECDIRIDNHFDLFDDSKEDDFSKISGKSLIKSNI